MSSACASKPSWRGWSLRTSQADDGLLREEIQAAIDLREEMIRYCYVQELRNDCELTGVVTVEFTIGADGTVADDIVLENSTGSQALGACIRDVVLSLLFPKPVRGGDVAVSYPWMFRTEAASVAGTTKTSAEDGEEGGSARDG